MVGHFHDLSVAAKTFFLDLHNLHFVNREESGFCSLSSAVLIYHKKAPSNVEKEGVKHISFCDLTLILIFQLVSRQLLQTLLGKKFTE